MRYMNRDTYDIEEAKKVDEYEAKQKALLEVLNKAIKDHAQIQIEFDKKLKDE
jgi:hypothetical protein